MKKLFYSTAFISGIHFKVFASEKGIIRLIINEKDESGESLTASATRLHVDDPYLFGVISQLSEYFNRLRKVFSVPLDINGTNFQIKVWNELRKIPFGKTISYKTLSINVGDVNASRAVAQANGANPVPIIIPCHRVINSNGSLGGYSGGLDIKEKLLELEGSMSMEIFD